MKSIITREQIINCLKYPQNPSLQTQLVKDYSIENGKDEVTVNGFLQVLRELDIQNKVKQLQQGGFYTNHSIITELFHFILEKKIAEFNVTLLIDKNNNVLKIY